MSTFVTWIGGGNNSASNPDDWTPTGAPQPGEYLSIEPGEPVNNNGGEVGRTINISGNALAGDTLTVVFGISPVTLNLSHHAQASLTMETMSGGVNQTTINLTGTDMLTLNWDGTEGYPGASLTVNGGPGAKLVNDQTSSFYGTYAVINTDVLGVGSYTDGYARYTPGFLEFGGSVSSGQTVTVEGAYYPGLGYPNCTLQIDHPREFHGSVILQSSGEIDLVGLANADGYSYANDMLSIYTHHRVIDTLLLTNDASPAGQSNELLVGKVGNSVWVEAGGLASSPSDSTALLHHV